MDASFMEVYTLVGWNYFDIIMPNKPHTLDLRPVMYNVYGAYIFKISWNNRGFTHGMYL